MTTTDHLANDARAIAERAAKAALDYLQASAGVPFPFPVVKAALARAVSTVELHGEVEVRDERTSPDKGVIAPDGLAALAARDAT